MVLTISTTHRPATDLGHLLRKHPAKTHVFNLNYGRAHLFYPEATDELCTVALLLEIDPVGLVRNRRGPSGEGRTLDQYVNDRPYVASSFLSVALADVFSSAMAGKSKDRQELVDQPLPLEVTLAVVPCRAGEEFLRRLFEPLGYQVTLEAHSLDTKLPEWGDSPYFTVTLKGDVRLRDLLTHLYLLIPVLDNDKHYWVGDDEVKKLLRKGEGWLEDHPEKRLITARYLKYQRGLVDDALERLVRESELTDDGDAREAVLESAVAQASSLFVEAGNPVASANKNEDSQDGCATDAEDCISLNEQRLGTVLAVLKNSSAKRVVDLGCGEGKLLRLLLKEKQFESTLGMDVSHRTLEIAQKRLKLDRLPERQRQRISLIQGSLMYRDERLAGFDAAAVIEVIEHLDPPRLAAFERAVFEFAKPGTVVITTPNREYNGMWESLPAGQFRHKDHRFEWTRDEFQSWANRIADRFGYVVKFLPVGPEDSEVGSPTQMGVFVKQDIE